MTVVLSPSGDTSNDLLSRLQVLSEDKTANYRVIAQDADEVRDLENAPAVSMSHFITATEQTRLLTTLSIYSERGASKDEVRLLYMNEVAFSIWKAMGKSATVVGERHRPPLTALLSFGIPFSE
jgi:hypothetical protein